MGIRTTCWIGSIACSFTLLLACASNAQDLETYFIDSQRSTFDHTSSPWGEPHCQVTGQCEFGISGTFKASGSNLLFVTEVQLSLFDNQHRASDGDRGDLASRLATKAKSLLPLSVSLATPIGGGANLTPTAMLHDGNLHIHVEKGSPAFDGERNEMDLFAVPQSRLDCNGDGVLDIHDVNCLVGGQHFSVGLSALKIRPGDLDGDGEVAFDDFLTLSANFGADGQYVDGDLDGDGQVAFADFLEFSANFGEPSTAALSVPEPQTTHLWLFLIGLVCVFRARGNHAVVG